MNPRNIGSLCVWAIAGVMAVVVSGARAQPAPAGGDKEAEIAQLKRRLAELEGAKAPAAPGQAAAQAPSSAPLVLLEQSPLVVKDAAGAPVVADAAGKGIDGVKLSQHDMRIGSPSIAVAPDGSIHVAFVEQHRTSPFANFVYHRSSADGGKTWTEAKNLSEDMPNIDVGLCKVLADSHNRVYVIWRAGLGLNFVANIDPTGDRTNIWFRELEGGKWSKAKLVSEEATNMSQPDAAFSYFAAVDGAGNAQVLWNVLPDKWHPELMTLNPPPSPPGSRTHCNGIQMGLVFQSTLDGATAGKPREAFLAAITPAPAGQAWVGPSCDGLNTLNGYVDTAGAPHFIAAVSMRKDGLGAHASHFELIENGKAGQMIDLPNASFHEWRDIPTLLVDAKGKRHMIALYLAGEHPSVRDYPLGSDEEPTVIRAAVGLNGQIIGFQAYQGPGGRMAAVIQTNDTGDPHGGDTYLTTSTGDGKWGPLVNVTNNAGRKTSLNKQTSVESRVMFDTSCLPGPGAVAFDKDGHLLLLLVKQEYKIVHSVALGVVIAGGDTITPTLRFLRF